MNRVLLPTAVDRGWVAVRPLSGAGLLAAFVAAVALLAGVSPAQAADDCPNAAVRAQQHSQFLAGCRDYEQVSPADKSGQQVAYRVGLQLGIAAGSRDGDAATFGSWGAFGNAPSGMPSSYRSYRKANGWVTESVTPPPVHPLPVATVGYPATWTAATPDLAVGIFEMRDAFDPIDVNDRQDVYATRDGATAQLVARGNGNETGSGISQFNRMSEDGRTILFQSNGHLVPADAARVAGGDVYVRKDGVTTLLQESGGTMLEVCGSQAGGPSNRYAVSTDGSVAFFETVHQELLGDPACTTPRQVYARNLEDGSLTQVSRSQLAVPEPTQQANFEGATSDGRFVFLTSAERLTDDAQVGGGLYRYNMANGALEFLLTSDETSIGVFKISADGSTVYFASYYDFAPGAIFNAVNLYVLRDGEIKFVAADESGTALAVDVLGLEGNRPGRVTPDGRHLLFSTSAKLTDFDPAGKRQVYLYDDDAGKLTCVSCDPAGQRPAGSVPSGDATLSGLEDRDPPLTDDGETVVFDSLDQLVPEDVNGARDVYEYRDGRLHLVSPGRANSTAMLVGMSGNGRDVFFVTSESLSGSDVDGGDFDLYDARVGGGFPDAPPAPPKGCEGDACQGRVSDPVVVDQPGSATLVDRGSLGEAPLRPALTVVRPSVKALRQAARTGRLTVAARVRGSGTIAASASASGRRIASASRRVSSATQKQVSLTLRLSSAARRTLRARGRLAVTVTARYAGISRTTKLTLKVG